MGATGFMAHISEDGARIQSLLDHLDKVACLAERFCAPFGAAGLGYCIGKTHDLGKYSREFQRRIRGESIHVDHSTAGGQYIALQDKGALGRMAAYCILGHHGGLPDGGSSVDSSDETTLNGRLKRNLPDYSAFDQDIGQSGDPFGLSRLMPPDFTPKDGFSVAFLTRMLYSALVDADWLDTEAFMAEGRVVRGAFSTQKVLCEKLMGYLTAFQDRAEESELNAMRNVLLQDCAQAADNPRGLFTLTAPTGSGKTLSSAAFALRHAAEKGLSRVIYVVPYNTIIEQNAAVFEGIFGIDDVVQHHGGVQYEADEDSPEYRKLLATENWDAPFIVTSSVRFFESLYANKPSACRKLHNIANSVIILDEAQMIPLLHLIPCVRVLEELVVHYACTVVLATATQSSLDSFFEALEPKEIVKDPQGMYEFFRRVTFERLPGTVSDEDLAERLQAHEQVLCIVNTRKKAQVLTGLLGDDAFHLSTTMVPAHRSHVLSEIRMRLKDGERCRVISTSMIEAGVDVDFPVVYREKAGLDSIIQAAGRCNREGKQDTSASMVYVCATEEGVQRYNAQHVNAYEHVERNYEDIASLDAVQAYFEHLRYIIGREALDKNRVIMDFNEGTGSLSFPFKAVAQKFKLIDDASKTVIVPVDEEAERLLVQLRYAGPSRAVLRALQHYSVSLYESDIRRLEEFGVIEHIDEDMCVLSKLCYDERCGVILVPKGGQALFV
jgi:CRISPR-associated helicase Cas3/CRISPR-associated endonuclease Cas3-HD